MHKAEKNVFYKHLSLKLRSDGLQFTRIVRPDKQSLQNTVASFTQAQ